MQRMAGTSTVEGFVLDWVRVQPEPDPRLPVSWLGDAEVAAELALIQRNRARDVAREAELILRLAELRPDVDDPRLGTPGARSRSWRRSDPEFAGVSEFFPDEVAHAINLGRGTAAFRARRAHIWRDGLPATFAALHAGRSTSAGPGCWPTRCSTRPTSWPGRWRRGCCPRRVSSPWPG